MGEEASEETQGEVMPERLLVMIRVALIVGTIFMLAVVIFEPFTRWLHRRKKR